LGSDIPVCLDSAAAFMEGRGEILRPVRSVPLVPMLLVNPGVAVPTRDVFAALQARSGVEMTLPGGNFQDTADLLRLLDATRNDLEPPAIRLQPVIADVLNAIAALPGALLARMSGSGATCFGIFADADCCDRAARTLSQAQPSWWVEPTFVPECGIVHETAGQDIGPSDTGL
jgi:4-diphosphocytidyl-2-C-methyl-D-erythritol kinase